MKFAPPETEEVSINLTPLIDIVFLLLIFFMVSTTFQRETELEISLPEASANVSSQPVVSAVILEIDSNGTYRVGTQSRERSSEFFAVSPARLLETLKGVSGKRETTTLIIKADANTSHQTVISALNAAQKAGFKRIKFATEMTSS
ncbi:MAG TPA: biopolymer transporter ExbD [Gammaproteobacteria bacterium]|nr:biopolymer transporter ExbD [Gammaproteobacteria bacterium]